MASYDELEQCDWQEVFHDSGTGDWREGWFLDGERATVRNTPGGMVFAAGPIAGDNACHEVLWTRDVFAGDVRIEFNYTRLDTASLYVNLLYIQASGIGGEYPADILTSRRQRQIPYMNAYYDTMNLLHISFAVRSAEGPEDDYVRCRRYPASAERPFKQTVLSPSYERTRLFLPGETYHITAIKTDEDLYFRVVGEEATRTFHWSVAEETPLQPGRIGLRHMCTRCARYRDVRVSTMQA